MQRVTELNELMRKKAQMLLENGIVNRIIGWKKGEFIYDRTPAVFQDSDELSKLIYDGFCGANLSKYLIQESKKEGKILALLKPCDTYSFNQLIKEHQINRENVYVLGIGCPDMIDINKIRSKGFKGILKIEEKEDELIIDTLYGQKRIKKEKALLEKCLSCKGKQHVAYDELFLIDNMISDNGSINRSMPDCEEASGLKKVGIASRDSRPKKDPYEMVEKIEAMTPDERFAFWRSELSKCIRCNACRNVCPACVCVKCIFDNDRSGIASKANTDAFEENMFHIIRALHVAGRCTDCGECSRVCPQQIPLHLLNRKIIKDINEFYGQYQAGADTQTPGPLTSFKHDDVEPYIIMRKGGHK
ncbi:MAG TPA: 4Fe-4S ferredoxin [Clostridiaceae bacterium]|nr:4Fe-4S ferredoxin [Clostridiaceae bacterium]